MNNSGTRESKHAHALTHAHAVNMHACIDYLVEEVANVELEGKTTHASMVHVLVLLLKLQVLRHSPLVISEHPCQAGLTNTACGRRSISCDRYCLPDIITEIRLKGYCFVRLKAQGILSRDIVEAQGILLNCSIDIP